MDSQAQAQQDARDMAHPAPVPNSLPPKPARPPSASPDRSPPRKRPRTQAIRRAAPAPAPAPPPSTIPPPLPSSTSTKDFAVTTPLSRFPIQPLNRFHGPSARIKRPQEVAHFSYDDTHTYRPDGSSLTYYHRPTLGSDLKAGFSSFNHYEDTEDPHLDSLLRAVAATERATGKKTEAHIVTWRGMMTKILTAPFDAFAEFEMRCTLLDGCIYLEEDFSARQKSRENEAKRPQRGQNPNLPDHAMMSYWGYKFETLSMLPVPPGKETPEALDNRATTPVSNHAQYCSIVSTALGPHTLLLGGEVDGLSAPRPPYSSSSSTPVPWVELKTSEELPSPPSHRDILRFERKLLKFWAQSFLLGVPKIVIGWRSKMGILTGVQELATEEIPGMVRRGTACWEGKTCVNFAVGVLGWLREVVKEEGRVYRVRMGRKGGAVEVLGGEEGDGGIVGGEWRAWRGELEGMGGGVKVEKEDEEKKVDGEP